MKCLYHILIFVLNQVYVLGENKKTVFGAMRRIELFGRKKFVCVDLLAKMNESFQQLWIKECVSHQLRVAHSTQK